MLSIRREREMHFAAIRHFQNVLLRSGGQVVMETVPKVKIKHRSTVIYVL